MLSFPEKKLYLNDSKVGQMEYKMGPKVLKLLQAIKAEKFEPSSPFQYNDERNNYVFPSKWFGQINNQGKRSLSAFYLQTMFWKQNNVLLIPSLADPPPAVFKNKQQVHKKSICPFCL